NQASPLPLDSMMYVLWSAPPQTLGMVSPASRATSTNWTGEVGVEFGTDGFGRTSASRRTVLRHFQTGVVSASKSELPRTRREEPRKRRRGRFITSDDPQRQHQSWQSSG